MGKGNGSDEVLVVCSDRNMGTGIAIWDMETGDRVVHIPTCASPLHGLLCLRDQFLVASQVNKHGSVGGGAIFTWALNKPQQPLRSYPLEAIGPLGCTKDGLFLAGGSPSGNVYLWEVADGRLLKTWRAHSKCLKCLSFSKDDSLLISGSEDGVICVWSMVSLLDTENFESSCSLLHYSSEHTSSVTGLLTTSGIANSTFISSSLDATCKAWDVVSGRLIQTQDYPLGITAIVTDLAEQLLFAGDEPVVLKGHNGSITALTFSSVGLISASEDCTVCLWDVISKVIIRRFSHHKGAVTNLVVIPRQPTHPMEFSLLHTCSSPEDHQAPVDFKRTNSLDQQIFEMEQEQTPAAMQMKVETSMDHRTWARRMTNHVMEMNRDLQSRLLDSIQIRLLLASGNDSRATGKSKKLKIESPPPLQQEKSCPGNEQAFF
ncbi:WD-REPEAT PROTEIN 18 [Salix viminalis]|uniref:WD-REPEAT PROTEIN 18 n=1 Tax=Salix viminalis TaxID=40686 RepID=A0A9Q0SGT0_SALVM|nr:WD-REPEAT PROTEIN 18 [Salix viminalis]